MCGRERRYSIFTLTTTTDIDIVTALKKMSTRDRYFELLDEFVDTAPVLIETLGTSGAIRESTPASEALDRLHRMALNLSSPSFIWDVAKLASAVDWGKKDSILENMYSVSKGADALCEKIRNARDTESPAEDIPPLGEKTLLSRNRPGGSEKDVLQEMSLNFDIFEKIFFLIENIEFEHAIIELQTLLSLPHRDEEVEGRFRELLDALQSGRYAAARSQAVTLRRVLASKLDEQKGGGKKKILAVDDFPETLRMLKMGLKDRFDVFGVTNHMTALKYLSVNVADLILLDIEMPDMDGFTLLGIIRRLENYRTTPVLFLTAKASTEYVKMAHDYGADDFVRKPVDLAILIGKIHKHLSI